MLTRPNLTDLAAVWTLFTLELGLILLQPGWSVVFAGHVVLVSAFWGLSRMTARPLPQIAALFTLGTGPYGAAIAATLATVLRLAKSNHERNAEWYHLLSGKAFDNPSRSTIQDLRAGRLGRHREPPQQVLKTIFESGTRGQRQAALRWLAQQDLSNFTRELQFALESDDNTIRIEAAALAGRLHNPTADSP